MRDQVALLVPRSPERVLRDIAALSEYGFAESLCWRWRTHGQAIAGGSIRSTVVILSMDLS